MSDLLARALDGERIEVPEELMPLIDVAEQLRAAEHPRPSAEARAAMKARLMAKIGAPASANGNGHHANGDGVHTNGNGHHKNGNGVHANGNGHGHGYAIDADMAVQALGPGANGKVIPFSWLRRRRTRLELRPKGARRSVLAQALPKLAAACLVTAMLAGGTVATSADTLPGDVLYPAKIAVEKVQLAATTDEAEKARLHLEFADRRLTELEKQVERGEAPTGTAPLAVKYSEEIQAAAVSIQRVATTAQSPVQQEKVAQLSTRLIADTTVKAAPRLERLVEQEPAVKPRVQAALDTAVQIASANAPHPTATPPTPFPTSTPAQAAATTMQNPAAAEPTATVGLPTPTATNPPRPVAPVAQAAPPTVTPRAEPTPTEVPLSPLQRALGAADRYASDLAAAFRNGSAPAIEVLVGRYGAELRGLPTAFREEVARGADREQAAGAIATRLTAHNDALSRALQQAPPVARPAIREYLSELQAGMRAALVEVGAPVPAALALPEPTPVPTRPPAPASTATPLATATPDPPPTLTPRPSTPTPVASPTVAGSPTAAASPTTAASPVATASPVSSPAPGITPLAVQPSPSPVASPAGAAGSPTAAPASPTAAPASPTAAPASPTAAAPAPTAASTPLAQMTPMRLASPTAPAATATAVPATQPTAAPTKAPTQKP